MVWPLADTVLVPVTLKAPVWLTAPALVVCRLPVTVVAPRLVVPALVVVVVRPAAVPEATRLPPAVKAEAPVAVSATVKALVSVIWTAAPVAETAPVKSLLALVSVIAWPTADSVVVPLTWSAPFCVIAPPAVIDRLPPTLELPRATPRVLPIVAWPSVPTVLTAMPLLTACWFTSMVALLVVVV